MPSASLNNMAVATNPMGALLMPKLKYRFRVLFYSFGAGGETVELTKQVMTVNRPNLSFEDITIPVYNTTLKLAGKPTWADVACEIRDDASGSVSKLIGEQLQKQMDFLEMSSAPSGIDYKFITRIEILDGGNGGNEPVVLEGWELYGCYLKSADYGQMSYAESAVVTIALTIAYDNANQLSGVGVTTGRSATPAGIATGISPTGGE